MAHRISAPWLGVAAIVMAPFAITAHAGGVDVQFAPDPARYADAGENASDRERTLQALDAVLRAFGARLPADATLRIELLEIDLAGSIRHGQRGAVRVLRGGADWPRLELRYTLSRPGQADMTGQDVLTDMQYQSAPLPSRDGPLPYEKRLLERWFSERFGNAG